MKRLVELVDGDVASEMRLQPEERIDGAARVENRRRRERLVGEVGLSAILHENAAIDRYRREHLTRDPGNLEADLPDIRQQQVANSSSSCCPERNGLELGKT